MPHNLDLTLLRTLVAISDCGGFTPAAKRLNLTQSTVSQHMKRLEEGVGRLLFRKQGRGMLLTEQGELLLAYARRMLELNDEVLPLLQGGGMEGRLRFGSGQAFTEYSLPQVLARFARIHPGVNLEVTVTSNQQLYEAVHRDQLDLALLLQRPGSGGEVLGRLPLVWLAGERDEWQGAECLPLVLFTSPCPFRERVLEVLEKHGECWRVGYSSPSLPGLLAAVRAGLGVTAQTPLSQGAGLHIVKGHARLPDLGEVEVALYRNSRADTALLEPLAQLVTEVIQQIGH